MKYEKVEISHNVLKQSYIKGFTLAEVLITIMVIGVLAVIVIPNIVKNIEKFILKNQIKEAFSTYSQIYTKLSDTRKSITNQLGYDEYNKEIVASLDVIKTCKENALTDGCIKQYEGLNISGCTAVNENYVYNKNTVYVLKNGSILIGTYWLSMWLIDVNGIKPPNKAGYDLFLLMMHNNSLELCGAVCINQSLIPGSITWQIKSMNDIDRW